MQVGGNKTEGYGAVWAALLILRLEGRKDTAPTAGMPAFQ